MKTEAIVYQSNTGFTKRYAELLSSLTGLEAYDHRTAGASLKRGAGIFYMGWLMAGNIKGYKKARRRYSVKGVAAVGMSGPADKSVDYVLRKYQPAGIPVFYLQGGFDKTKLRGVYKLMMSNMEKAMENSLNKKEQKTEADLAALDVVRNGGDYVKKENLDSVISWNQ
jgi:hypothetical protein